MSINVKIVLRRCLKIGIEVILISEPAVMPHINVDKSAYSKIEKGSRNVTVEELQGMATLFGMTMDQVVNYEGIMPQEVTIEDKSMVERVKLIEQLNEEDKKTIFSIIDKMLTNKKFKDFFNKNVAAL